MEAKDLTFPRGVILGAGLILAGILGVAAVACGARFITRRGREDDRSTATAFDLDAPKYAWLR
jgi:hypothetical protein